MGLVKRRRLRSKEKLGKVRRTKTNQGRTTRLVLSSMKRRRWSAFKRETSKVKAESRLIDYIRCLMATLIVYLCKRTKALLTFSPTLRKLHECTCDKHGAAVLFPFIHRFKRTPDLCSERWRLKRHADVSRPFVTENGKLVCFPTVCVCV